MPESVGGVIPPLGGKKMDFSRGMVRYTESALNTENIIDNIKDSESCLL
jgi:hypothetical protein